MKGIALIITLMIAGFSSQASAAELESRSITLWNDVVISGTELAAGEYTVQWSETGAIVQIRFLRNGREIVSVQGNVIRQRNQQDSITTRIEDEGRRTVREISFSNTTLRLAPEDESRTE